MKKIELTDKNFEIIKDFIGETSFNQIASLCQELDLEYTCTEVDEALEELYNTMCGIGGE